MGANGSKKSVDPPQQRLSETQVKRLLEAQKKEYEKKYQRGTIAVQRKLEEVADTSITLRTNEDEDLIAAYRKLQEKTAYLSEQRKKQEEAFLVAQKKLQEEADNLAAQRKLQEEIFNNAQKKIEEEAAKAATQRKLQEEAYIAVQRKLLEEATERKLKEDAAKTKLLEEAAQRKLLEEAAKKKLEEETAKKKLEEEIAAKKIYLKEIAERKLQEDAAKRTLQEEAVSRKLKEEAWKIKLKEEFVIKKKNLEDAFQKKLEEDATRRKIQEEAFQRKLEEEAAERKLQEEALKRRLKEEAVERKLQEEAKKKLEKEAAMKIQEQPTTRTRDLPRKGGAGRYCHTCFKQSRQKFFKCDEGHGSCIDCRDSWQNCGICSGTISFQRSYNTKQDLSPNARVPCPHRIDGCKLNIKLANMEVHVKECPFQEHDCPLGSVFGNCNWKGELLDLSDHFEDTHPNYLISEVGTEFRVKNIHKNRRFVWLVENGYHFVFHMKISESDKKIYMTVQLIGTKHSTMKCLYEIQVYNKTDTSRKYVYEDNCRSTIDSIDDVFQKGECAVLPKDYAKTFVNNGAMTVKCFIKRIDETGSDFGRYQRRNLCSTNFTLNFFL